MKKFMVVYTFEGDTCASFYDDAATADNARMDISVSLGEHAEVYERITDPESGPEYRLAWC